MNARPTSLVPCLTLWQPWASLLMAGAKQTETRPRALRTLVSRRVVICAGARRKLPDGGLTDELRELCRATWGGPTWVDRMRYGVALGSVWVAVCERTEDVKPASDADRIAGNWAPGRYAMFTCWPIIFNKPVPIRGQQGVFYVDPARFPELV